MSAKSPRYLSLGYPLDQIFNRQIPLPESLVFQERAHIGRLVKGDNAAQPSHGGIHLPDEVEPGTGNIVIRGKPGAAKTTLAMQIATSCYDQDSLLAAYISFEQPVEHVQKKAERFGWHRFLRPVTHLHNLSSPPSPEELGRTLALTLLQHEQCPMRSPQSEPSTAQGDGSPSVDQDDVQEKRKRTLGAIRRLLTCDFAIEVNKREPHLSPELLKAADRLRKCYAPYTAVHTITFPELFIAKPRGHKDGTQYPLPNILEALRGQANTFLLDIDRNVIPLKQQTAASIMNFYATLAKYLIDNLCRDVTRQLFQRVGYPSGKHAPDYYAKHCMTRLFHRPVSFGYWKTSKNLLTNCAGLISTVRKIGPTPEAEATLRDLERIQRGLHALCNMLDSAQENKITPLLFYSRCMSLAVRVLTVLCGEKSQADDFTAFLALYRQLQRVLHYCADFVELLPETLPLPREDAHVAAAKPPFCVLLPAMTPRSVSPHIAASDHLFWERYRQLEALLEAGQSLRNQIETYTQAKLTGPPGFDPEAECVEKQLLKQKIPYDLRVVCVDSLNVFADRPLTREETYRIFDLFRRHQVIGIFVLEEENEAMVVDPAVQASRETAEYLADMVMHLAAADDQGYLVRHLEVVKSRYQHQVYGKQPFRLEHGVQDKLFERLTPTTTRDTGIVILPSLHYLVAETTLSTRSDNPDETWRFIRSLPQGSSGNAQHKGFTAPRVFSTGITGLDDILPVNLRKDAVVAIKGPRDTFKTSIALNFLFDGLRHGENVLLLHLSESCRDLRKTTVSRDILPQVSDLLQEEIELQEQERMLRAAEEKAQPGGDEMRRLDGEKRNLKMRKLALQGEKAWRLTQADHPPFSPERLDFCHASRRLTTKFESWVWRYQCNDGSVGTLTEFAFKSGMLVPEQFMEMVRQVFYEKNITRVLVDDIALIGMSYPLLRSSLTSGDLFLSALIHFLRNHQVGVMLVGTTSQVAEENDIVNKACLLANAVVNCDLRDIFGDRYVLVTGEGLVASSSRGAGQRTELVPGVVRLISDQQDTYYRTLYIDTHYLEGLVGFDTDVIHRPGALVHMFSETGIQQEYNEGVRQTLAFAYAEAPGISDKAKHILTGMSGEIPFRQDDLHVRSFDSRESGPLHESLGVLDGKPLNRTVVATIDEFWLARLQPKMGDAPGNNDLPLVMFHKSDKLEKLCKTLSDDEKAFIEKPGGIYALPYYHNVLMLAYHPERLKERLREPGICNDGKTPDFFSSWSAMAEQLLAKQQCRIFEFDTTARETFACLLLDALFSNPPLSRKRDVGTPRGTNNISAVDLINGCNRQEVTGMIELLRSCVASRNLGDAQLSFNIEFDRQLANLPIRGSQDQLALSPHAAVYVCWYTQLRELVRRHSELASQLRITPLPGGGFTGDWYLGIINGSVSLKLGSLIIEKLTEQPEEYSRFVKGVGLPFRTLYYDKQNSLCHFSAWQGSVDMIDAVEGIYAGANHRCDITDYPHLRQLFTRACEKLASEPIVPQSSTLAEFTGGVLNALSERMQKLFG